MTGLLEHTDQREGGETSELEDKDTVNDRRIRQKRPLDRKSQSRYKVNASTLMASLADCDSEVANLFPIRQAAFVSRLLAELGMTLGKRSFVGALVYTPQMVHARDKKSSRKWRDGGAIFGVMHCKVY